MLLNTWELVNTWEIPVVVVPADDAQGGGFWDDFETELRRRKDEKARRLREKKKARKVKDKIERQLYLAERELESEQARKAELARINRLVARNQDFIYNLDNPLIANYMEEALAEQTFSKMERLERTLARIKEEEDFLMVATQIILDA